MNLKTLRLLDTLPLPPVYYDARKDYYLPDARDGWVPVTQSQIYTELVLRGYDDDYDPDADLMSEASEAVNKIQKEHHVGFVGPLAGWQKGFYRTDNGRILVTESTKLIPPVESDWEMLRGVLTNMLGHDQLPFLYGWLKVALEALTAGQPRTGQALVLCGERDAGKNLLRKLISAMFGGRVAKPYQYMTKGTSFNYELFEAAVLAVEDESGARDIRSRQAFGDAIKNITANEEQRCHRKNCDPVTLLPCWRLIVSLNDEPVKMLVLPPMEKDIEDKMILFKVTKQRMPMHTDTGTARLAFWAKLRSELPGFLHFLEEWQIPVGMRSERFGVAHYHHPDLLDALQEFAPEDKLRDLIDEIVFGSGKPVTPWIGKAEDLRSELRKHTSRQREVDEVLPHQNSCGTLLGRLRDRYRDRYRDACIQGRTRWTIEAPESSGRAPWFKEGSRKRMGEILSIHSLSNENAGAEHEAEERASLASTANAEADRWEAEQKAAAGAVINQDAA